MLALAWFGWAGPRSLSDVEWSAGRPPRAWAQLAGPAPHPLPRAGDACPAQLAARGRAHRCAGPPPPGSAPTLVPGRASALVHYCRIVAYSCNFAGSAQVASRFSPVPGEAGRRREAAQSGSFVGRAAACGEPDGVRGSAAGLPDRVAPAPRIACAHRTRRGRRHDAAPGRCLRAGGPIAPPAPPRRRLHRPAAQAGGMGPGTVAGHGPAPARAEAPPRAARGRARAPPRTVHFCSILAYFCKPADSAQSAPRFVSIIGTTRPEHGTP